MTDDSPSYGDLHATVLGAIKYLPGGAELHRWTAVEVLAKLRHLLPFPPDTPRDPDTGEYL